MSENFQALILILIWVTDKENSEKNIVKTFIAISEYIYRELRGDKVW